MITYDNVKVAYLGIGCPLHYLYRCISNTYYYLKLLTNNQISERKDFLLQLMKFKFLPHSS